MFGAGSRGSTLTTNTGKLTTLQCAVISGKSLEMTQ